MAEMSPDWPRRIEGLRAAHRHLWFPSKTQSYANEVLGESCEGSL